jgi:hypothetical protein
VPEETAHADVSAESRRGSEGFLRSLEEQVAETFRDLRDIR